MANDSAAESKSISHLSCMQIPCLPKTPSAKHTVYQDPRVFDATLVPPITGCCFCILSITHPPLLFSVGVSLCQEVARYCRSGRNTFAGI